MADFTLVYILKNFIYVVLIAQIKCEFAGSETGSGLPLKSGPESDLKQIIPDPQLWSWGVYGNYCSPASPTALSQRWIRIHPAGSHCWYCRLDTPCRPYGRRWKGIRTLRTCRASGWWPWMAAQQRGRTFPELDCTGRRQLWASGAGRWPSVPLLPSTALASGPQRSRLVRLHHQS